MVLSNDETINAYNKASEVYLSSRLSTMYPSLKTWLNKCLSKLSKDSKILEIGSGSGIEADYIESLGYIVQRTEASTKLIEHQTSLGKKIKYLNILKDRLDDKQDLILANAVLLHFKPNEITEIFNNVVNGLNSDGLFAFSLKAGEGDFVDLKYGFPRYFKLWTPDEILQVIENHSLNLVDLAFEGVENNIWLNIITQKYS